MNRPVKQKMCFASQNNGQTQRLVAPLCGHDYDAVNVLMEIKQVVVVSPVGNAFRQKGLMSSGRSTAKLFNSLGGNRKYPVKG